MRNFLKDMLGGKREWRQMQERAAALPRDYRIVYDEIMKYLFKFSAGSGMDTVALLNDLLGLFESGAADGRRALEVTGEDVAAFCDELLRNANTYTRKWHEDLNRDIRQKLGEES